MKEEYISIETLKTWQEVDKENVEMRKKINRAIRFIKRFEEIRGHAETGNYSIKNSLLKILKNN